MRGVGGRSSHGLAEVRAFAGAAPLLEVERCLNWAAGCVFWKTLKTLLQIILGNKVKNCHKNEISNVPYIRSKLVLLYKYLLVVDWYVPSNEGIWLVFWISSGCDTFLCITILYNNVKTLSLRSTQSLQWANSCSIKIPLMFTSVSDLSLTIIKLSYVKSVTPWWNSEYEGNK